MNANIPADVSLAPVTVGASVTNQVVSRAFTITSGGSKWLRIDVAVGKVVITNAVSAKLQHSSGLNLWSDTKSVSITASTEKTVSAVDTATDTLTSAAHGYATGDAVVINSSGAIPGGLNLHEIYYIYKVDANNVKLTNFDGSSTKDITSAGSGTITLTAVRQFTITVNNDVAGDQTYTPLRSSGRIVVTSGASDSCQIVDILRLCEE